jgi:hypothetical protein
MLHGITGLERVNIHKCCLKTVKYKFFFLRGFSPCAHFEVAANMKAQHQYRNPPSGTVLSITSNLSHDGPSVVRDLKPGPPKYKSGMLLALPRRLAVFCCTWKFQNRFPYQYSLYTTSRLSVTTYLARRAATLLIWNPFFISSIREVPCHGDVRLTLYYQNNCIRPHN